MDNMNNQNPYGHTPPEHKEPETTREAGGESAAPGAGPTPGAAPRPQAGQQPPYGQQAHQTHQYTYNPYWYQNQSQPYRPAPQQSYGGPSGPSAQPPAQRPQPKKGGAGKVLGAIALMLACLLCGFGGSWAGMVLYSQQNPTKETVVYQSVEPGAEADTTGAGTTVSDVAEMAGESVVSITTENVVTDFAFGGRIVSGAGSGVIISEDGTIVTNNHVVEGARNVSVTLPSGEVHPATVLGTDKETDMAVIKIDASGLSPAVIGDSDYLRVGEFCMAIGNPMGTLGGTVTDGIISALDRTINIDGVNMHLLQMSAAVSPGNSGGGLFNAKGELIGVVNAKNGGDGAEGLGFAIPVNTAMQVAETLISEGRVVRPALGVTVVTATDDNLAAELGVPGPGVYVNSISPGSAAANAGLQVGDRIVSLDGTEVTDGDVLSSAIRQHQVGDTVTLVYERNGQQHEVSATLGELQPEA